MIKKIISFLICFVMVVSGLNFKSAVKQVEAAQYNGTHFAMEFNGYDSAVMEKSNGWSNGGMFDCTWRDTNVLFFDDGIMNLRIDSDGNGGYTGGEYRTRQTFGYGMYQVNMKPIKNPGVVSSFFTYTGPTDGTRWDEIDIEFLGYDTTKVQFNYFSNGVGGHEYLYDLGFDASQEFHTYGFFWGEGVITWYVDGKAVYTVTSGDIPVTPGKIMMNVWPGTGVDDWLRPYNGATPLTAYYDWAVYDAPGSGSEPQTTKPVEVITTKEPATEPATESLPAGYVMAGPNWNELNYWSPYFASGWAGNPTGGYKDGNSYNDFSIKILSASSAEWGIQMKTKSFVTEPGNTYICKITVQSNIATSSQIRLKDDISNSEILKTLDAGTNYFELQFTAGTSAQIFFDLGQAPAGLEFSMKSFSLEKVQEETEAPTEEPTSMNTIDGGIEINGYQINTSAEGMRTVYSVDSVIDGKQVVSSGIVYSISKYATEDELYVGSPSQFVRSFQSTNMGKTDTSYSKSDIATSYAMTMKFTAKKAAEYSESWRVCAYAQLSDGTYVYTDKQVFTIYEIADNLYQNGLMTTKERHDYLYTDILSIVNKEYQVKEYLWRNTIVEV